LAGETPARRWWDALIVAAAVGVFVYLARGTVRPPIAMDVVWILALVAAMLALLVGCGALLWKRTRFS
jgi:hypothetical protein